mgnify:CR=1 FL=1
MPLGKGVRYRVRRLPGGRAQRLAFKGNKAVEVQPMRERGGVLKKTGPAKRIRIQRKQKRAAKRQGGT